MGDEVRIMAALMELPVLAADPVVCRCLGVRESHIREAVASGTVRSIRDLRFLTGAGDGCMACHRRLRDLIEYHRADS
jgi:bacterioferritin-associated ferredoxin